MFKTNGELIGDSLLHSVATLERNYIVQKNDYLSVNIYTNNGEQIVDPTGKLGETLGLNGLATGNIGEAPIKYLVETDGMVKLPMLGRVLLEGYTISQADSVLEQLYGEYYNDAFVYTRILNKRVILLGAGGGMGGAMVGGTVGARVSGAIIELENENMNLIEVLAKAGGVDQLARVSNIRIIRGDLKNPNVYLIDLTTIEGMRRANLNVQPNDIIYVERYTKVVTQALSEISSVTGLLAAIANTVLIFILLRQR